MDRTPLLSWLLVGLGSLLPAQVPVPASVPRKPHVLHPEVVLADGTGASLVAQFGLGDGGFGTGARDALRFTEHGVVTSGGVHVDVLEVGVRLTFPSGRELLLAADGWLHLRGGEKGGPFPGGCALHLADGAIVRIGLVPTSDAPVRDVTVVEGRTVLQPWRRGEAATAMPRSSGWNGVRLVCCGDGGELFRAIALGPLVVLDRVLVPEARVDLVPEQRLVVLTDPLLRSLALMPRQHRETEASVRHAVAAVGAVAEHGSTIFPVGASLQRVERDRLRWQLGSGFELQLDLDGDMAPRLQLFAGTVPLPMIEWTLRAEAAAFLTNPREDQATKRWHGNGTRLVSTVPELQAREELFERALALRIIGRLRKQAPRD
jgi:hypothetical protein